MVALGLFLMFLTASKVSRVVGTLPGCPKSLGWMWIECGRPNFSLAFAKEVSAGMVVGIGNSFNDLISYGADCCIKDFTEFECEKYL